MKQKKTHHEQAKAWLRANCLRLGESKPRNNPAAPDSIHSIETFEKYAASLGKAAEWAKVAMLRDLTAEQAGQYLKERAAAGIGYKQIAADFRALTLFLGVPIEKPTTTTPPANKPRAYTTAQIVAIVEAQPAPYAISTILAFNAGLRGQELLTLRRVDEGKPQADRRDWNPDRFQGRQGVRYLVTGKAGLVREVMISTEWAAELEKLRLDKPRTVKDRHITNIVQYYDIKGGNNWENNFTLTAQKTIGFSNGAHGLRHSYAQFRLEALQKTGRWYKEALAIVAGELGHFRAEISKAYMR